MSERVFRQFFGPSPRHERACVELTFPLGGGPYRLAPLDPVLMSHGFKLREFLLDEPMPLDEAVCRLAGAMLAKHTEWWSRHGSNDGRGWAAIAFPYPQVAASALESAFDAVRSDGAISPDLAARLERLSEWLGKVSQIKMRMLAAAEVFGRDAAILNLAAEVYQVGQGAKGLHFHRMANERDSLTGVKLERNKQITAETLRRFGLPATHGVLVKDERQAAKAIEMIGLPCVVKPTEMSRGAGVAAGLADRAQVEAALAHALKLSQKSVLLENHVEGYDHRLTVIGEELLWVYRKVPARIVGDGAATVHELIERENRRRAAIRSGTEAYLYQIAIDRVLARFIRGRYGLGLDSVPPAGESIELASQANIARGGLLEDVTGSVHPDVRELAIRVARLFRIDALGIDYITPDISRSWKEIDTAIVEVNRTPGISGMGDTTLVHRTLFPNRLSGSIPMVAAIGDESYLRELAETIGDAFAHHGLRTVMADYRHDGAASGAILRTDGTPAVETALLDPDADAIVVLCDPERVESAGLPLRRCDLVAVEDRARFGWLAAETVLAGSVSQAKIDHAVGKLARRYKDPAEGGPLPVLETISPDDAGDLFRLKVWRARAMPRSWFWSQVGLDSPDQTGLTTHADLLAAVKALADQALDGAARLPGGFTHDELVGSWFRVTFEAAIALPPKRAEPARMALLAATERVNAIAVARIA